MNSKMTIRLRRRTQAGWLLHLLLILSLFHSFCCEVLGLPEMIRYIIDVAWVILLVLIIKRSKNKAKIGLLPLWVLLFFVYTVLDYLPQYQSGLYYLWGMRNVFRTFVAFFSFVIFMSPEDVEEWWKLFNILFWVNFVLTLYQNLFLGLKGDHLGGIFSTVAGGNGYTNIFNVVMLTKECVLYLDKKEKIWPCASKCLAALVIAAMAEMKFFFIEFAIVLVLASLCTRFTWRKLWIIVGGFAALALGMTVLAVVFPDSAANFTIRWLLEEASADKGYTSAGDLNRLNAIPRINELWLNSAWKRLFGLGLGNCETSGFAIVNTPFYEAYGDMHYSWLSYAFLYLETGWIGLLFYYGFFVLVCFGLYRIEKHSSGIIQTYCRMGRILAIMCMIISVYNSSLRTEAAYMMFFALSVPFVMSKEKKERIACVEEITA